MKRSVFFAAVAVTALFLYSTDPAMAQGVSVLGDETLQFRIDYWMNQLDANLKITSGLLMGTSVDAFDTLGMDVHMQTFVPIIGSFSRFGFHAEYWRNTYEGLKNLDEPVIFNGKLYPAGDLLESKLVIDNFDLRVFLDVLPQKKLDFCPMVGIRYKRYEVWLEDLTTTETDNEILHAPMPYVGGKIRFNISRYISFGGDLGIMNITFSDYDYQLKDYMDFHAYAEIRLTPMFAVVGGYRYTTFRISAEKDEVDYLLNENMQGMFVGVALVF